VGSVVGVVGVVGAVGVVGVVGVVGGVVVIGAKNNKLSYFLCIWKSSFVPEVSPVWLLCRL
jgi:hypothetical protein